MLFPILPTLAAARPLIPRALVDDSAFGRALGVARRLPDAADLHYLECRLAEGVSRVDYQITGKLSAGSGPILAGRDRARDFDPAWLESPAWQRIRAFFLAWEDESGALRRVAPIAGLEFDLEGPDGDRDPPVPQVLFCVDPGMDPAFDAGRGPAPSAAALRGPIEGALSLLRGRALQPSSAEALGRCFDALPAGGQILHMAALIGRAGDVIRCVPLLPVEGVLGYLDRIGWQGPREAVREVLARFCRPGEPRVKIDVDIDGQVLPKFALAADFTRDGAEGWERARPLLDELVRAGLCSSEKRDSLRAWPGCAPARMSGYGWPIDLERHMDFKVVAWHDERLEAKAYLGICPRFSLF